MLLFLTHISSLQPIQNSLQLETVNGLSWNSFTRWAGLTFLGSLSELPRDFRFPRGGFLAILRFFDKDDLVGAFKTSRKDCAELVRVSL